MPATLCRQSTQSKATRNMQDVLQEGNSHFHIFGSSDGFCCRCTNSNLALVGGLVGGLGGGPAGAAAGENIWAAGLGS